MARHPELRYPELKGQIISIEKRLLGVIEYLARLRNYGGELRRPITELESIGRDLDYIKELGRLAEERAYEQRERKR